MQTPTKRVFKYTLNNGLTVLVCPKKLAPKVSMQLWYNVGSKHEATGEKGMAHFIEHMIFKGTEKMLSESDINQITQKLSGYTNAFTSFDYTGYLFDIPVANWDKVLPVFADCMSNCTFDEEHMNSEVKAVIQELKMYRDDFTWSLADALITNIFESHPYHNPIIGYKQDLWSLKRQTLVDFYKKYYVPQNASMIIVGDVDPEQAFEKVKESFGSIPRGAEIEHPEFYINDELQSKSVTLYREVEQPMTMLAFSVPGSSARKDFVYDIISYLLANGKGARLQKLLVDDKQLAVSVGAMSYDLFDREIFFIEYKPKHEKDIETIKQIILEQINEIVENGIPQQEFRRALKLAQVDQQQMLEHTQKQAYAIGKSFVAIGDEEYPFTYCDYDAEKLYQDIIDMFKEHFRSTVCYQGNVCNIPESEKPYLAKLQKESDEMDTKILFGKDRKSEIAPAKYVQSVDVKKLEKKSFVMPKELQLENGLKVLLHHSDAVDTVELFLAYKASRLYDTKGYEGVGYLASKMMLEGTTKYMRGEFIKAVESYGISIGTTPGQVGASMLGVDVAKGLEFVSDMLQHATFNPQDFDRIKDIAQSKLKHFWDTPTSFASQVAAKHIYKDHPYAQMVLGTKESLEKIDRDYCFNFYKKMITPQEAHLSIVGNFDQDSIEQIVKDTVGSWQGQKIQDIKYPAILPVTQQTIAIEKNRDQVVLAFAGLSVDRMSSMYDKLLIFDQILSGGMSSRLFALREQSGLFYTIGGSLVHGAGKQPGMLFFKTIVSKDRLQEAEKAVADCLDTAVNSVTDQEFEEAQEVVVNSFPALYESNGAVASTLLFLQKYNLPYDYFENRIDVIRSVTKEEMIHAVKEVLNTEKMLTIKIGRL